jgi:hypothetical protein
MSLTKSAIVLFSPSTMRRRFRERVARRLDRVGAGSARDGEEHEGREHEQREHRGDDAIGHVATRVAHVLGGQGDPLDGEEEPDAVLEGGEDASVAERQELARARGGAGLDVGQVRGAELLETRLG